MIVARDRRARARRVSHPPARSAHSCAACAFRRPALLTGGLEELQKEKIANKGVLQEEHKRLLALQTSLSS